MALTIAVDWLEFVMEDFHDLLLGEIGKRIKRFCTLGVSHDPLRPVAFLVLPHPIPSV